MKLKALCSVMMVMSLSACAPDNNASSEISADAEIANGIVGAEKLSVGDSGAKATVAILKWGQTICTGTLISRRTVVTAAHCVRGVFSSAALSVKFMANPSVTIDAPEFIAHKDFENIINDTKTTISTRDTNDIALLGLIKDAPSEAVPARLPAQPLAADKKYKIRAFGVGQTGGKVKDGGPFRMVNITGEVKKKRQRQILFDQRNGKGICLGDSGGPHFMYDKKSQPVLVGITTGADVVPGLFGKAIGDICRYTTKALQTGFYIDWIKIQKATLEDNLSRYY